MAYLLNFFSGGGGWVIDCRIVKKNKEILYVYWKSNEIEREGWVGIKYIVHIHDYNCECSIFANSPMKYK